MGSHDHIMTPVIFGPDTERVTIYATAGRYYQERRDKKQTPDFGLYADRIWYPSDTRNEFLFWPDFGIPKLLRVAQLQIIDAYIRACKGEIVEVGCIGAHGRTGTILACMAVLAGHENPVEWVREHYCPRAVETSQQADYVDWFENHSFGDKSYDLGLGNEW